MGNLRETILAIEDLPIREVDVPEWGMTVKVRGLDSASRDMYLNSLLSRQRGEKIADVRQLQTMLVQMSVLNGDGELAFTPDDIDALDRKSPVAIKRIADVAYELSALRGEEAVEEMVGNSPSEASGGSGSS